MKKCNFQKGTFLKLLLINAASLPINYIKITI